MSAPRATEAEVVEAGVAGLASLYQAKATTPTEVAEAYVARVRRFDRKLNAYRVPAGDLVEQAKASTTRWANGLQKGPLDGVPIAVKSNIAVRGLPWDGGIGAYRDRMAREEAEVVRRLRASGALILGTLNMEEGALGAKTDNPWFGPTYNPHREGYTAGGSSGGSGAAVAAGLCAAALGTDTMGSVRIPASYCGVVGVKPGRGAVPDEGLVPLSRTLDTIGPLGRSVADARAVYEVIAGAGVSPLLPGKVGIVSYEDAVSVDPVVRAVTAAAARHLSIAAFETTPMTLPDACFGPTRLAGLLVAEAEGFESHREAMTADPDGFSPFLTKMLTYGGDLSDAKLKSAYAALIAAERSVEAWQGCDALLLPTTPQTAFPMSEDHANQADLTAYANAAGLVAISVPAGRADGLPIGMQVVAREAGTAFRVAEALEDTLGRSPLPNGYA